MIGARGAAVAVVAVTAGCVVPPTQSSLGAVATGLGVGYRASVGAHAAAADRADEIGVDVGAGWVSEGGDARDAVHGTYISLGRRFVLGPHHALWLTGRAEMFWLVAPGQPRDGLVARLTLRRHLAGVGFRAGDSRGAFGVVGAIAAGLYADVGARRLDGGGGEVFASAGVTLDLPFMIGFAKPAWW